MSDAVSSLTGFASLQFQTHDGITLAKKVVAELVIPVMQQNMHYQESLCASALEHCQDSEAVAKYETARRNSKRADKKSQDMFSKLSSYTVNQLKNQAVRFGLNMSMVGGTPRSSWGIQALVNINSTPATESREYEDVLVSEILNAPIVDICIIQGGEHVPDGYFRCYKTPGNRKANLNSGSGGNPIYLCIKKDLTGQFAPITNIIVIFPNRGEYVPPGYHVVPRGKSACNVNVGTSSEHVFIGFKRDFLGNPITDLQLLFSNKNEEAPRGFSTIDKSIYGTSANLNIGTGGADIFLSYKQELIRLWCLLNDAPQAPVEQTARQTRTSSSELDVNDTNTNNGNNVAHRGRSKSPMRRDRMQPLSAAAATNTAQANASDAANTNNNEGGGDTAADATDEANNSSNNILEDDSVLEAALDTYADFYDESNEARQADLVSLHQLQVVVDANGNVTSEAHRKTLIAILSGVYIRQGNVASFAIAALSKLLKDTDFFRDDLTSLPVVGTITMLDLAIESACDRFDLSPENDHVHILTFLKLVVRHSGAKLSPLSVQKIFRTINYLCNCYATKPDWLVSGMHMPCNDPNLEVTPFKVLRHLVMDAVAQAETVEIAHFLPDNNYFDEDLVWVDSSASYLETRIIVEDLIEDVIDSVDTSRICEATFQTISKQSYSTGSSAFWQLIHMNSRKLFQDVSYRSAFVTLCAICKQAWHVVRTNQIGEPIPRDLGSKLVALEAITEFLSSSGERLRASKIMGYQIRRIVVPCLLYNVTYALLDHKIFAKVLHIMSALWKKWRRHVRIEFAILCDQVIFKVLQASVWQIRPVFQMMVIQEVVDWFDQPHLLIEMFVNYDMDRKFVSHWNTFSYLIRSLCAIGRRLSVVTSAWDWKPMNDDPNHTNSNANNKVPISIRDVHLQALEEVSRMAKVVMDASGHAFLIIQDATFRNRSLGASAGWVEDEGTLQRKTVDEAVTTQENNDQKQEKIPDKGPPPPASTPINSVNKGDNTGSVSSVRSRRAAHEQSENLIQEAIKIYVEKDYSLKKAVQYLIAKDFMPNTPQEIANFLRVYKNSFDPAAIGEFLGEGGKDIHEEEYWAQIRFRYTRAVSFVEMDVEQALRLYLTGCGFRLPGEAQKINRFVEVFVKAYWQDNSGSRFSPFSHSDTIHLLSYAIIMLNTDLHRANLTNKKGSKKMSKEEFCNNLRGADQGKDIDREYLARIYDSVAAQPIELAFKTTAKDVEDALKDGKPVDDILNQKLSSNPTRQKDVNDLRLAEEKKFIREIGLSIRDSEDLLRSLAPFTFRFQITNIDTKISLDLVSFMFETVWFHFHAVVESIFNATAAMDTHATFAALDILCYALTSAIFLDLKVEKMAFATLMKKFRDAFEAAPHMISPDRQVPDESWYTDCENISNANDSSTMETIAKIHKLTVHLKDTIQEVQNYEITRQVAAKFEKKAKVLEHNTFFIRQGDLNKLAARTGRPTTYRFFLFSDHLIYAHLGMKKEFVVHEQLSLAAMTIADLDGDPTACSFHITHPTKSFTVFAESPMVKVQWIRDINHAITSCKKRETARREGPVNRRMSMFGRIEDQQTQQLLEHETTLRNVNSPERGRLRRASYKLDRKEDEDDDNDEDYGTVVASSVPFSAPSTPAHALGKEMSFGEGNHTNESCEQIIVEEIFPTPEERARRQQEKITQFLELLGQLPEKGLNNLYTAGGNFWKGMSAGRNSNLPEAQQTRIIALQRAARYGSLQAASLPDAAVTATTGLTDNQLVTWQALGEISAEQAKRDFLSELIRIAPYWRYDQFL